MRIYPAVHYVMGGLWVDYDLQSNDPRPVRDRRGELLRPRRQPARRLRADAGPGRRVLRAAATRSATTSPTPRSSKVDETHPAVVEAQTAVEERVDRFLSINGTRSADSYHKELGQIMWEYCGMERSEEGLRKAIDMIRQLKADFWTNLKVLGTADSLNQSLEKAGRVADFIELGELMCIDALNRRESCGGHFRAESQTEDGEALRDDDEFAYVAAWEFGGEDGQPGPAQGRPDLHGHRDEAAELQVSLNLTLKIWRQPDAVTEGAMHTYEVDDISAGHVASSRCSTCSTSS